jgi:hypothetical protein
MSTAIAIVIRAAVMDDVTGVAGIAQIAATAVSAIHAGTPKVARGAMRRPASGTATAMAIVTATLNAKAAGMEIATGIVRRTATLRAAVTLAPAKPEAVAVARVAASATRTAIGIGKGDAVRIVRVNGRRAIRIRRQRRSRLQTLQRP